MNREQSIDFKLGMARAMAILLTEIILHPEGVREIMTGITDLPS